MNLAAVQARRGKKQATCDCALAALILAQRGFDTIRLLDYLRRSGGTISNCEYQDLFLISKRTASNDLSELTAHGLLVVEGAGRAMRYRLTEPDAGLPDFLPAFCPIMWTRVLRSRKVT